MYDILIIGAGVTGCAIARELSRYDIRAAVIEKEYDVSMGTSRANSAIIHAGYDAKPGTLKAKMNILGNPMFDSLAKELNFHFKRIGALVLCFEEAAIPEIEKLKARGDGNGVPGLEIIDREGLERIEPNIGPKALCALYAPTSGIVCPYEMTIALAENANMNGVDFYFGQRVTGIAKNGDGFLVKTGNAEFEGRILINAAGVFADEIHNMAGEDKLHIIPRSGQYLLMDKSVGGLVSHTLFQLPSEMGKGVLVTPTVDGNLLLGPTAVDIEDKGDISTKKREYDQILSAASLTIREIPVRQVITSFAGIRAHSVTDDFIIGHVRGARGMIDVAGIESPGLTGAPAIGVFVRELVGELTELKEKNDFQPRRDIAPRFCDMDTGARIAAIKKNPRYGKIICRCENVSEAEIIDSIRRPLGAKDLDAVKRRTRAGMGRCQGGFCSPQVAEILARELGIPVTCVTKSGPGSEILAGRIREVRK